MFYQLYILLLSLTEEDKESKSLSESKNSSEYTES